MDDHNGRPGGRRRRRPRNRQRDRVLQLVREHEGAVDAAELAARLGLHVTTVRFHLDALCDRGAVARTRITRRAVGRPRTGYVAAQGRLDYRGLAEILALELGDTAEKRRRRAERAGRRWAERLTAASPREPLVAQDVPKTRKLSETLDHRTTTIAEIFQRMGFDPDFTPATKTAASARARTIRLHACPVRELAQAYPEVGCALHLGLLQGLLAARGGRSTSPAGAALHAELEPFVEPELCIARVIARD